VSGALWTLVWSGKNCIIGNKKIEKYVTGILLLFPMQVFANTVSELYIIQLTNLTTNHQTMEQSPSWELISTKIVKKYSFMEFKSSLLCSQGSIIGPYPEPDASRPHSSTLLP